MTETLLQKRGPGRPKLPPVYADCPTCGAAFVLSASQRGRQKKGLPVFCTAGAHNRTTGQPDPDSKSGQVRAYLLSRYPCQEVPRGALTEIAERLGVTRQLVSQQAKKLAYALAEHIPAVRLCECGNPALNGGRCAECRFVPVACEICGRILRRDRKALMNNISHGHSQAIVCSGMDLGWANKKAKTECAKERMRRIRAEHYWSSAPKK